METIIPGLHASVPEPGGDPYLAFDFVVPGIAPAGEPYHEPVEKPEAERRIDEILARLPRDGSG